MPMAHMWPSAVQVPSCHCSLPQFPHWQQDSLRCFSAAKGVGQHAGAALRTEGTQRDEGRSGPSPQASCGLRTESSSAEPCRGRALPPCLREEPLLRCRPPVPPPASRARPGTAAFSRAEPSRAEPCTVSYPRSPAGLGLCVHPSGLPEI